MLPFTPEELEQAIADGNVSARFHPEYDYTIYNYTPQVQYSRHWTPVTKTCRGLILGPDYEVIARPFEKFFNYTEIVPDPVVFGKRCWATDKLDGSLGIIYPMEDFYGVATRGSFTSDQAIWATKWLKDNLPDFKQPDGVTTLVEIIYPDNRIVLDYQGYEGLVLLAAVDNETGADIEHWNIDWWPGDRAELFETLSDADSAYHRANEEDFEIKEGLVLTYYKYNEPAFRLKVKNAEYIRLHGIIHNFSPKKVWEALREGSNFAEFLVDVPDEFYNLVKDITKDLEHKFQLIKLEAQLDFSTLRDLKNDRKKFAEAAQKTTYPGIMFSMLDKKDYSDAIWKMIKPKEIEDENE